MANPLNGSHPDVVSQLVYQAAPALLRPEYLATVFEPDIGTQITRITDNVGVASQDLSAGDVLHQYSKVRCTNADDSLAYLFKQKIVKTSDWSDAGYGGTPLSSGDSRWSSIEPLVRYGLNAERTSFQKYNLSTQVTTTMFTLPNGEKGRIGHGEGELSLDDQFVVITNDAKTTAWSYNIQSGALLGSLDLSALANFNWAGVCLGGSYIVVEDNGPGFPSTDARYVYNIDFTNERPLIPVDGSGVSVRHPEHSTFAYDKDGNDVLVEVGVDHIYTRLDNLQAYRTGIRPALGEVGYGHISYSANRLGWVYVTTRPDIPGRLNQIFAYRLGEATPQTDIALSEYPSVMVREGIAEVELWGHPRGTGSPYDAEPHGCVNRKGDEIFFKTNWDGAEINEYVVSLGESTIPLYNIAHEGDLYEVWYGGERYKVAG